ncbi:MAG: protein kinase [Gemmatimonadota bacterium]|nr:MAG: protein kinase [Gemmatimonadota bacterium]
MTEILERLRTALADRYDVERELGEGGMAIVFLAHDVKHERHVAIKVLRPELAASLGADRFLREIKIAAKLTHPHILPLYDSGEAEGLLFYVMPFVEGESLRDLLDREQQLPLEDAVRIAREVAGALAQAHSHGIIHRDIKPENVMLSGGHAVVADFGIARALSAAGGDNLTQTGMAVGTPAYMSPEQAAGDPNLDGRSDVYSVGCMLYEMLVGQIPFTGPNAQAIMARHTMDAVTPPSIMRQSVPVELEDVILRALEKAPADRFRTAGDFADALVSLDSGTYSPRRTTRAMAAPARKGVSRGATVAVSAAALVGLAVAGWLLWPSSSGGSALARTGFDARNVAVLYFEDRTPNLQFEYVADGLTEGLIQQLSRVPQLQVVSRNGVLPFKRELVSSDSIARLLEVGSLIEGVVDQVGDRVRVTVNLLDGNSGANLYREGFEIQSSQLLVARDSVVETASRLLRQRLGEEVRLRTQQASTSSVDAWSLVQRAEQARKEGSTSRRSNRDKTVAAYSQGDSLLDLARSADPDWIEPPLLRAQLALDRSQIAEDDAESAAWIERGLKYSNEALEIDPASARALALRGTLTHWLYRREVTADPEQQDALLDSAQADLEAAVATDPTLASAHEELSSLYYARKDNFSALAAARRAYEEDAYLERAATILDRLFWTHYDLQQFVDAERWCSEGARRFEDDARFVECQLWMMITPRAAPDVEWAWTLSQRFDSLAPPGAEFYRRRCRLIVGGVIGRAGLTDSANAVLRGARADLAVDDDQELAGYEAIMRTLMGDYDEAVSLLRRYVALNPGHSFDIDGDLHWWWRPLRGQPGFAAVTAPR